VASPAARRLPPELVERARGVVDGSAPAAVPRDAATVVLLRDAADHGVEAFVLERPATMAFAAGMVVFPGGAVDPRDGDEVPFHGPDPASWATVLTAEPRLARALVCAAVRETFEEVGVLLAGTGGDDVVALDDDPGRWWAEQAALLDRTASMSEVLRRGTLVLRSDLLQPWAHWVTPELEPKRFDTRFFVAALPAGQTPVHTAGESARSEWVRPADAVARHATGELQMLPPTVLTLAELAEYSTVADVLTAARGREIKRVLPRIVVDGGDVLLLLPGEPGYPDDETGDG
jgi:8-oxo-dGTP pyrophosphatase MutT (NUDIX family)